MATQRSQEREIDIEGTINEFEQKLDRLKVLYEQYFMGIEKRAPLVPLKDVVRVMRLLEQQQIRNTGLRFRYRNLVQKFSVFKTYWSRTLRAIELGTYQRDVARMSRNLARKGISMPQIGKVRSAADVERAVVAAVQKKADTDTEKVAAIRDDKIGMTTEKVPALGDDGQPQRVVPRGAASIGLQPEPSLGPINLDADEDEDTSRSQPSVGPPLPPRVRPPTGRPQAPAGTPATRPPAAASGSNLSEVEMQSLYRRFVKAKEMCGEDTASIRYDALVKSIAHQLPKIQAQHQGRPVEFQVVIRDGRAILRARPK